MCKANSPNISNESPWYHNILLVIVLQFSCSLEYLMNFRELDLMINANAKSKIWDTMLRHKLLTGKFSLKILWVYEGIQIHRSENLPLVDVGQF